MVKSPLKKMPQARRRRTQRRALRGLAAGLMCLSVLSGCGGRHPRSYQVPESRRLEADLGSAWEAAYRILAERGYDIRDVDRATGVIETDWLTVNSDYSANVFLTQNEDRYSDCGKPGLGKTYRGKQARLTVSLSAIGPNQTEILVHAAFRTERKNIFSSSPTALECQSRGRLEEEFLVETQVRGLANTLQRFRRGWQ
jgi:uncharacterized lipoprotein